MLSAVASRAERNAVSGVEWRPAVRNGDDMVNFRGRAPLAARAEWMLGDFALALAIVRKALPRIRIFHRAMPLEAAICGGPRPQRRAVGAMRC